MNKKIYIIIILSIILISSTILSPNAYATDIKDTIRVGLFYLEPYAYINSDGELDGYYVELFDLIAEKMDVEVEYVLSDLKNFAPNLDNGEVDIVLGSTITEEHAKKYTTNKFSIALEYFALYSNSDIDSSNFENFNNLRIGYINESQKATWIFNLFKSIGIDYYPVGVSTYSELKELMDNKEIDLMIYSTYPLNDYKKIYEFIGDQAYIAVKKGNEFILEKVDKAIVDCYKEDKDAIPNIYNSYFNEKQNKVNNRIRILTITLIVIVILCIIPKSRKVLIRYKINNRLKNNRYLLHYQPIYDPINQIIVGFEGLLRLKDKNGKLISPANFIPEIEKNNMLFDVTLWILKMVILDFKEIKNYNCVSNNNFYISLNLSIDEIKNNSFVDKAIELLKESNLDGKSICLEIVERVGIKDLNKITTNISRLRAAGFKIAIDDFGTDYSNLDVLEKLDSDIIKVDKSFIDLLGKDLINDETILFMLRVAEKEGKSIVLEGVENEYQDNIIKSYNSKNIFVQGYFYNKPMELKRIREL